MDELAKKDVSNLLPEERGKSKDIDPDTLLARICDYYLACLACDGVEASLFLNPKNGQADYFETGIMPRESDAFSEAEEARLLLARKCDEEQNQKGEKQDRYNLYFGYPIHIRKKTDRWSRSYFMLEPLLMFPMDQGSGPAGLIVDLRFPIINSAVFLSFTNDGLDSLTSEINQLKGELGFSETGDPLAIDEIARKLQSIRPEWPWKEDMDPDAIGGKRPSVAAIKEPGIHNRAVVLMAPGNRYTQSLEKELRALARLSADSYENTALGRWLRGDAQGSSGDDPAAGRSLLEVLPMNDEQRVAVSKALTRPTTIITGPPGTGKSQVVANLLVNAAWRGKTILFVSKNHKAVDVVEACVNELGDRPILLRLGGKDNREANWDVLKKFVSWLIQTRTTDADREELSREFEEANKEHEELLEKQSGLFSEKNNLCDSLNKVDRRERDVEAARVRLEGELFSKAAELPLPSVRKAVNDTLKAAVGTDKRAASFIVRLFWPILGYVGFKRLSSIARSSANAFESIGLALPPATRTADAAAIKETAQKALEVLEDLEQALSYREALGDLQGKPRLEDIARREVAISSKIVKCSAKLWRLWFKRLPAEMSEDERQKLGDYESLLKEIVRAGGGKWVSTEKYKAARRALARLLPCWAVTTLSAKSYIPFDPGAFDMVVFDEASQCDIASALPLLYRAKSVVIIGDEKQIAHVSNLSAGQNLFLLEYFDLLKRARWSYPSESLFSLGAKQVCGGGIVDLLDHYRSHKDIIEFSNREFYKGRLRVSTNHGGLRLYDDRWSGIYWKNVKGTVTRPSNGGAENEAEAKKVVDVLHNLVKKTNDDVSIGVVTPFRGQANKITTIVNQDENKDLSDRLNRRNFLAETVHKFQGDERDVMIFSPVVSLEFPDRSRFFLRSNGNLFNVAVTRARARLIVVGDIAACKQESKIGYLSNFARYAEELEELKDRKVDNFPIEDLKATYPTVANPEKVSDWERLFYAAAYKAGLRLIPQYSIRQHIVDFLLVDGERELVIEIDGEGYHKNWTGELCRRDQIRDWELIEQGYDVRRFWVYEVRDDIDGCLRRLQDWKRAGSAGESADGCQKSGRQAREAE